MSRLKGVALALSAALGLAMVAAPAGSAASPCRGNGTVERFTFAESSQGEMGGYSLYLPACYFDDDSTSYPAVYLLHGLGESDTHWILMGVRQAADLAITRGDIVPMILVMADGGPSYEPGKDGAAFDDYVIDELVPLVDALYRTIAARSGRAIGGISRGGGRALAIAAQAPGMFSSAGGHSGKLGDPADLALGLSAGGTRVWLDVGRGDYLRDDSVALAHLMEAAGGSVRLHVAAGVHESAYWKAHVTQYLEFYGDGFLQQ